MKKNLTNLTNYFFNTSIPGNVNFSSQYKKAPPPVDKKEKFLIFLFFFNAAMVSPPPAILIIFFFELIKLANLFVPLS